MDEQDFLKILQPIFADNSQIPLLVSVRDLWLIDSALAVTCRHPAISTMQRDWMLHIHTQIEAAIIERYPAAKEIILAGWDESRDVLDDPAERQLREDAYSEFLKKVRQKGGDT